MDGIYYDLLVEIKFDPRDSVVYKIPFKEIEETGLPSTARFLFDHLDGIRNIIIHKTERK